MRTLAISRRSFKRWTQNKRQRKEKEIKQEIEDSWMQCETQEGIAEAVGVSVGTINAEIDKIFKNGQVSETENFANFGPQLYTVWKFPKLTNQSRVFGSIPQEILDNLLYYFTKPFDVVFDPFGGGGMTIDVCKKRKRRYYVSDLSPIPARITEIRQHDITAGLPEDLPVPDFVFLDPAVLEAGARKV